MKSDIDPQDTIEVVDEQHNNYGRIRIREPMCKASVFLSPDQLEQHALECFALAAAIRARR